GYRGREQSDGDDVSIGNDERQALTRLDDGTGPQRGDVAESARGSGPDGVPVGLDPQTEERVLRSALFAFEPRDLAADLIERCRAIAIAGDLFLLDTDQRQPRAVRRRPRAQRVGAPLFEIVIRDEELRTKAFEAFELLLCVPCGRFRFAQPLARLVE